VTPKFSFTESPKGTLNLTVVEGPKSSTWSLTAKSRVTTLQESFQGLYEALGGLPERVVTTVSDRTTYSTLEQAPPGLPIVSNASEWDVDPTEPFPAELLLGPPQKTEQDSLNALAAVAARLKASSFWVDDPERLNPRLVNDLDAGERPPELQPYTTSVSVVDGKLQQ
jgi:hypothetical protein